MPRQTCHNLTTARIADLECHGLCLCLGLHSASPHTREAGYLGESTTGGISRLREKAESLERQQDLAEAQQQSSQPDLEAVSDRILAGLKVGKRFPGVQANQDSD